MAVLATILGVFLIYGIWEYRVHLRALRSIPVRIHVNGTRGKSSVTRLIAAGLRAGGIPTCAKTTGSRPRMILNNGSEYTVQRQGRANILEQTRAMAIASRRKAQAIVLECMALNPALQEICESKLIQATYGVITNIRADHLDVMGPTVADAAKAMAATVPRRGPLLVAEADESLRAILQKAADRQGVELIHCTPEKMGITEDFMRKFDYIEHPDNAALALCCCEMAGVPREQAQAGMLAAEPDMGALRIMRLAFFAKRIDFVNAFAANDPQSTRVIWDRILQLYSGERSRVVILNCRADRGQRSAQLGEILPGLSGLHRLVLCGTGTRMALEACLRGGLHPEKIIEMEGFRPEEIFERTVAQVGEKGIVFGMGNIGAGGIAIVEYFQNRCQLTQTETEIDGD